MDVYKYFIKQNCPVCGADRRKLAYKNLLHTCNVLKKAGLPLSNDSVPADIYECENCGHEYLSLRLKDELIRYYYDVVESEYYDSVKDNPRDRISIDTKKFADLIAANSKDCRSVLEIGSGMGHLLFQLKLKGFECTGVEPSSFASEYSKREFQLNVIRGLLDYQTFPGRKFDLIIMNDVVEHISDINPLFALIKHYLNPGGKVVVSTGNSKSIYAKICGKKWLYFFSWEHISFFNKSSMKYLLRQHSLDVCYYKNTRHSGTFMQNVSTLFYTFRAMAANLVGVRNHKFYYMAFDHLIVIGQNKEANN